MLYPDSQNIKDAQSQYYQMNGLPSDGGLNDRWARYKIGPFTLIGFPNFQHRMEAIKRHDLHHIVNNLDTSALGEGLIAAWELGSGMNRYWISWCLEPQALWWGILLAPRKTFGLFLIGKRSKNFFHLPLDEGFLLKAVGEIRTLLLPYSRDLQKAQLSAYLGFVGFAILGILMILIFIPVFTFFTIFGIITRQK